MNKAAGVKARAAKTADARLLHAGHFAFMRAVIQGLDERASWDRYLQGEGDSSDRRQIRRTIDWIRTAFAAAARHAQRPGTARLILLDPARLENRSAAPAPVRPSLEEFALAQGLEDFSEAEQIEAYEQAYPAERAVSRGAGERARSSRRARVIARQLEALRWLEGRAAHQPQAADELAMWLPAPQARSLRRVGLRTLEQLVVHINSHGARWWTPVRSIGAGKANQIQSWLEAHGEVLGLSLGPQTRVGRRAASPALLSSVVPPATGLVPLEKLILPADLDGSCGTNRGMPDACRLAATNDLEAVRIWLGTGTRGRARLRSDSATARSYRKEAERLLLWCVLERRQALSSLDSQAFEQFMAFLADPPAHWCGRRYRERWSPLWRPIEGAQSTSSAAQTRTILGGMFRFLVAQGWLHVSPVQAHRTAECAPQRVATVPAAT